LIQDAASNFGTVNHFYAQLDRAVIDKNEIPRLYILRKARVINRNTAGIADNLFSRKHNVIAALQIVGSILQLTDADFRTFNIHQNRNDDPKLGSCLTYALNASPMLF
jgi:hypothetical protein